MVQAKEHIAPHNRAMFLVRWGQISWSYI